MDKLGNKVHITLPPEEEYGDVEYKWSLADIPEFKRIKVASQMRWRVKEASDKRSALYIIGVHDNGQVTGIGRNHIVDTYINLMDCATKLGLYTCLRKFERLADSNSYWAILQVFEHNVTKNNIHVDNDMPEIPIHDMPTYIRDCT